MSQTIEEKMIDNSGFKERLISHIEYLHGEYILENITMKEYREKIQTIDPSLPTF
jgi:mRNA-degrading endonuclease HigB of HigAB toxin-antitoxin module